MSATHAYCIGCGVKTSVTWVTVRTGYDKLKLLCAACKGREERAKLEREVRK